MERGIPWSNDRPCFGKDEKKCLILHPPHPLFIQDLHFKNIKTVLKENVENGVKSVLWRGQICGGTGSTCMGLEEETEASQRFKNDQQHYFFPGKVFL